MKRSEKARTASNPAAAGMWVATLLAFALAFQGAIAAVAPLREAAASPWEALAATPLCAAHLGAGSPADPHQGPPLGKHEHCALCVSFGSMLLPAPPPHVAGAISIAVIRPAPPPTGPPARSRRAQPYASRAPPAVA